MKHDLVSLVRKSGPSSEAEEALSALERWDNTVAADSRGSVLFEAWWNHYYQREDKNFQVEWDESAPLETPRGLADSARALAAFGKALAETKRHYGTWDVS